MKGLKKEFQYGRLNVSLQTGVVARQTTAAVMIDVEGTVLLVTVVGKREADDKKDFFPLTVNYQERAYASGKIPGGFFKREGRPSEREILISRLIDRPIRPLFPKGFSNEVQVVATVLSINPEVNPDIPALIGASAALSLSGIPFLGPIAAARVGYKDGQFFLNPTPQELSTSDLDLIVAGTEDGVLMVESEANILLEEVMLEAVWFGHQQMQPVVQAINEFAMESGNLIWEWKPAEVNQELHNAVHEAAEKNLTEIYQISDKLLRQEKVAELKEQVKEKFASVNEEKPQITPEEIKTSFENIERQIVRSRVLDGYSRIDGRDTRTVRPLDIEVGTLPRTHGSAVFTRGETQALVTVTLGTNRDAQIVDSISNNGEEKERFILHYNFPPYCVGEIGMMMGPKRREIGHGKLAKRGLTAVLPSQEEFPYVLRVVSEITESNGSSSMASICGGSLALMDAAVPIKAPVAGIAMGLIKEDKKFAVLTDIIGDEDHLGDMDFKVAGTENGITALQMDIKINGITKFIMEKALEQAKEGRLHILKHMNTTINAPRSEMSPHAPRIRTMKINTDKIRDVIGKGGATIRAIIEETGANIDISDDGTVSISAVDGQAGDDAWDRVKNIVTDVEIGTVYERKITKLMDFGAFVNLLPGKDGFLHISQIAEERIDKISDYLHEGQVVKVKVVEIDRQGKIRLTMKPSIMQES